MIFSPSKFVKALGLPFVCLAMFAVAGGHWAVLQSLAWGQMLVEYSKQEGSLRGGVEKTFSGKAPCSMCKKIADAKTQEQKAPATVKTDKKSDTALVAFGALVSLPAPRDFQFPDTPGHFPSRSEAPSAPVPIVRA